jgi:hypothetical protein
VAQVWGEKVYLYPIFKYSVPSFLRHHHASLPMAGTCLVQIQQFIHTSNTCAYLTRPSYILLALKWVWQSTGRLHCTRLWLKEPIVKLSQMVRAPQRKSHHNTFLKITQQPLRTMLQLCFINIYPRCIIIVI